MNLRQFITAVLISGSLYGFSQTDEPLPNKNGKRKYTLYNEASNYNPYDENVKKVYNKSGRLLEIYYRDSLHIQFYENGNLRSVTKYKKGKVEGERMYYYPTEEVELLMTYKNGLQHGPFVMRYENGIIKYEGEYRGDRMFGERICYNEKGELMNGDFTFYGFRGFKYTGKCINGKPEGLLTLTDPQGNLYMTVNFKNGKPHGLTHTYEKGKIKSVENYNEGYFESTKDD